jgi:tetratricopeptide (TPR) repeat protein
MMKLACSTIFISFAVLQPLVAQALTSEQIRDTAKLVTFKIKASSDGIPDNEGSGVIVSKQGDIYTIVTNAHVVCNSPNPIQSCDQYTKYTVVSPNQQTHSIENSAIKLLPNLDLATIQFQSNQNYQVAELGDSDKLQIDEPIYTAGFTTIAQGFSFSHGTIIANVKKRLTNDKGGYTVIYDASTNKGMSGGGVFNQQGQIIAIHGQGDRYKENTLTNIRDREIQQDFNINPSTFNNSLVNQKTGVNRGIPIKYLKLIGNTSSNNRPKIVPTMADEWFILALNKAIDSSTEKLAEDTQEAIQACSKSISINPNYFMAYYIRGRLFDRLNMKHQALKDYSTVNNLPATSALQYIVRTDAKILIAIASGNLTSFDANSALTDINQAIKLDPKYANAYTARASIYTLQKNTSLAIKDLDQAIQLDPFNSNNFILRAFVKFSSADPSAAVADINQAIKIKEANSEDVTGYRYYLRLLTRNQNSPGNNFEDFQEFIKPNSLTYYLLTANNKKIQGDLPGALQLYDKAVQSFPTTQTFASRGVFKQEELQDYQGAEADFTSAINLQPNDPSFYVLRGLLRSKLMNRKEAIKDLSQAAALYKKVGNKQQYSLMMTLISTIK